MASWVQFCRKVAAPLLWLCSLCEAGDRSDGVPQAREGSDLAPAWHMEAI